MRATIQRAHAVVQDHPRHAVLAALVAGLLIATAGELIVLIVAAATAVAAGRRWLAVLAVAALVAGALIADARLRALDAGNLGTATGRTVETRAVVLEPVRERPVGPAVARVRLLDGLGAGEQAVLRVWPSAYAGGLPEVGDIVFVKGRIAPLGEFDAYQRRRNAHAAIAATRVAATGTRRGGIAGMLDGLRRRAEEGLASGLASPEAALLRGMVLGEDERLTEDVRDDFQRSGLAHILAVSGQNVMLLVVLVLAVCALLGVPLRARLLLAAAVVAVYVPLAGGGPSIQRAGVMGAAGLVAALAGRPARRWYALLLAAAATLALNPRAVGEPGWQLSFAAVAALLLGAAPLRAVLARRMPSPAADAAAITLAATIGTAPLMAIHFQQVSLAALPANLLAAPEIAPVMWLGVLAAAAAQIAEPLAAPFSALTAPLLVYLQTVAHLTAALPLSVLEIRAASAVIVAGWVVLVIATFAGLRHWSRVRARVSEPPGAEPGADRGGVFARRSRHRMRLVLATTACASALLVVTGTIPGRGARAAVPRAGELVVSFLDVGQGDATLIQLGGASVLVDTGPPDGPILKRLDKAGVKRLDALVLTHAEADHEGAAPAVIGRHKPRLVIDGGSGWSSAVQRVLPTAVAAARGRKITPVAGQVIAIGALRFEVLWPLAARPGTTPSGNPNDHALVARLEVGEFSMLLSADAESNVTAALALEPVDVLKVAHHGSADLGLPALLKRLSPRVAAIEVGRGNRYGHPTASTLAALKQAVPMVLRTDRDGTVRLHALGDRVWVEP
jgi:competence protein ComEC